MTSMQLQMMKFVIVKAWQVASLSKSEKEDARAIARSLFNIWLDINKHSKTPKAVYYLTYFPKQPCLEFQSRFLEQKEF